jgi:hypothetical protein
MRRDQQAGVCQAPWRRMNTGLAMLGYRWTVGMLWGSCEQGDRLGNEEVREKT